MIYLLSFAVVFTIVAVSHELGHLIAAHRIGIAVYEFAIGFGPTVFSFKIGKTKIIINLLPLGGYVKVAGMDPEHDEPGTPEESKYYNKKPWPKLETIVAGAISNLVIGFFILYCILVFVGAPTSASNKIETVLPGSVASEIGLQPGDLLVELDSAPVNQDTIKSVVTKIHQSSGKKIKIKIQRENELLHFSVVPRLNKELNVALIGVSFAPVLEKPGPIPALALAAKETLTMIALLFALLAKLFCGQLGLNQLAGPIGIAQISGESARSGLVSFLSFIAFFSINVGVLNLLPLPALDGGRLVFILIEMVRKKAINIQTENKVHYWGMVILLFLLALISANDLLRLFGN